MAEWESEKKRKTTSENLFTFVNMILWLWLENLWSIVCAIACFSAAALMFLFLFFRFILLRSACFFIAKNIIFVRDVTFIFFLCLVQRNSICMMNLNNKKIKTFPIKFFCNYSQVYSIQSVKRRYKYRTLQRTRIALCHRM